MRHAVVQMQAWRVVQAAARGKDLHSQEDIFIADWRRRDHVQTEAWGVVQAAAGGKGLSCFTIKNLLASMGMTSRVVPGIALSTGR